MNDTDPFITSGKLAVRLGAAVWQIEKLFGKRLVPFVRAGRYRLVAVADIELVREALVAAGYLPAEVVAHA